MERSSTNKVQKIVIWIILIAMAVGSVGAYFVVILQNENAKQDTKSQADTQKQLEEAQKKQQEQEAKVKKEPLDGYEAVAFDKASVTELKVEDLQSGTGDKEASASSTVTANYFGWTSDGKIFDSSKRDGKVSPASFPLNQVISGWTEGLKGAKAGTVRKLTIPADKAYGSTGNGPIGPNEPLVFIVEVKEVK